MMDDDAELMQLASCGDTEAFRALVERYQEAIYNYFLRSTGNAGDAEDLTQQLFINLFRSARRYRVSASFKTYIYRIAFNLAASFARSKKGRTALSLDLMIEEGYEPASGMSGSDPGEVVQGMELQRAYADALLRLPHDWRTAIELRVGKGFSYKEIAGIMGRSVSAVESIIFRAREALARELGEFREKEID